MFYEFNNNIKINGNFKNKKNSKKAEIKLNKTDYSQRKKYNNESHYLRQYKKYFHKKLSIKYNILPKEYTLMQFENFIKAKYCHSLAKFKEDLLYNYGQEFLNKYYSKNDSIKKVPLFTEYYKTYLLFFCRPTLAELNLNELIEEMVERKAKAFYQENYQEEKETKKGSKKTINTIFFTNKVRKDISRKNTLTDLSKTTIDFIALTNKNSINSYSSINNLVNEIGTGKINKNNNNNNNINSIIINKNPMTSRPNNPVYKNEKIKKIIKNIESNSNYIINPNLIKKKSILKNSTKSIVQPGNKLNLKNINKKIKDIKVKSINNYTQSNASNKNIINNNNFGTNPNKTRENINIAKPLYHKINIVNNKIIIINNNNRSKGNILKTSKEKIKKKNNIQSLSRNYKNNFFSSVNNNTIGVIDNKDKIINNPNYKTNDFLLKSFKEHYHKKGQSTKNYHSMQTKSDTKIQHIKIIKDKNINLNSKSNKQKNLIQAYKNKNINSNLFMNYLNTYKNINISTNTYNHNLSNINKIRQKKLTNYQIFSNNIKNINQTQKIKNITKEKFSPFYKIIHSTCTLCPNSKNKNILKIKEYNTLDNSIKSKYKTKNINKKLCSTQEQIKTKLEISNTLNKNMLSLKYNKK